MVTFTRSHIEKVDKGYANQPEHISREREMQIIPNRYEAIPDVDLIGDMLPKNHQSAQICQITAISSSL